MFTESDFFMVLYNATKNPTIGGVTYDLIGRNPGQGNCRGWAELKAWLGNACRENNNSAPQIVRINLATPQGAVDVTVMVLQQLSLEFLTPLVPIPG